MLKYDSLQSVYLRGRWKCLVSLHVAAEVHLLAAEFSRVQMQRGGARSIPCRALEVDREIGTIQVN